MSEEEMLAQEEYDRLMLEISSKSLIRLREKCIKDGLEVSSLYMPWSGMTAFRVSKKKEKNDFS